MSNEVGWDEPRISKLRALWADGHSTAEIGRRMGLSKNAIVGKVHRIGLTARPSPIVRTGDKRRSTGRLRIEAARKAVLPKLASEALPPPVICVVADVAPLFRPTEAVAAPLMISMPARENLGSQCSWPIGEPGTKAFRFCDEPCAASVSYCAAHRAIAYVRVSSLRDRAARA